MRPTIRSIRRWTALLGVASLLPMSAAANDFESGVILLAGPGPERLERSSDTDRSADREATPDVDAGPKPGTIPVWVPRARRGVPASRVGGATRAAERAVAIQVLVPEVDEAAVTLAAQPRLYWHLSAPTPHRVNFTLNDPDAIDPIIDTMLEGPFEAGVHVVSLADHAVKLESGRHYEWFVAVVPDPEDRALDSVARGAVFRVADEELSSQAAGSSPDDATALLARSGIWYEAFDVVSEELRKQPEDSRRRERRDALLRQVGLTLAREG